LLQQHQLKALQQRKNPTKLFPRLLHCVQYRQCDVLERLVLSELKFHQLKDSENRSSGQLWPHRELSARREQSIRSEHLRPSQLFNHMRLIFPEKVRFQSQQIPPSQLKNLRRQCSH
jgi:hypothetical protein